MKFPHKQNKSLSDMHAPTYRKSSFQVYWKSGIQKARVYFLLLTAMVIFLYCGCEKDDDPQMPPTIRLESTTNSISSDTILALSSPMNFTISAAGNGSNLTNLIVQVSSGELTQRYLDTSMNTPSFTINKSFVKGLAKEEVWTFILRDKNRQADSLSLNIALDTTGGFGPIKYIGDLIMSAQNNPVPGSFFSCGTTQVYTLEQAFSVQESIDLVYYDGEDNLTMGSPGAIFKILCFK